ncbi:MULTISPECIES: hypothetical protein [unclassified Corynebacterium]|uniref:hypothetical protein n=1 Tax=unclassified Corynebacterium TaxID=2624378 RepID=UPI0029CA00C2|nr:MULTISPECIES: hypothetical protein [unclassified Corynebacterium]WPF65414.1 hypothetical protein OLX12_07465 [Corynebacterium sp. 22KM0430]WPF67909.1 hypothetical protein OLW90_07455 [Corynebacterium sp. 21KM1197]
MRVLGFPSPTRPRIDAPRYRRALLSAALGATLVLSACSTEDTPENVEAPVALQVDPARVLLHNPGTAPHRTLEYAAERPEQQVSVAVTSGFEQQVMRADAVQVQAPEAAQDAPLMQDAETLTLPLQAVGSAASSDSRDAAGDGGDAGSGAGEGATRRVDTTLGKPTSFDPSANAALESTQGFTLGWQGDANGRISTVDLAAPTEADDDNRALIEKAMMKLLSLPVIFPDEPVGVGAVWSVDSRVTGEATLLQTTTYTLTALDGDAVELNVSVQQRPAQGALVMSGDEGTPETAGALGDSEAEGSAGTSDSTDSEAEGQPETAAGDQTLDVMNANTSSTGTLRLNLNEALPHEGTVALTTRVVYGQQESDVRVVQDTATRLRFY